MRHLAALQQVAIALGIATAAVLIRVSTSAATAPTGDAAAGYSWAPALSALLLLFPLMGAVRLPHGTGATASARRGD